MADEFSGEISEAIGQFRVVRRGGSAEDPDVQQRTGVLRFCDNAIELEVSPAFTPVVAWTERRPGTYAGSPPRGRITDDAVLLGVVATNPGEVSLWGLDTVAQRSFGVPMPGRAELSREVVAADWCLVGAHFPSDRTEFSAVTLDMTGLHRFAALPSIRVETPERGMVPLRLGVRPTRRRGRIGLSASARASAARSIGDHAHARRARCQRHLQHTAEAGIRRGTSPLGRDVGHRDTDDQPAHDSERHRLSGARTERVDAGEGPFSRRIRRRGRPFRTARHRGSPSDA